MSNGSAGRQTDTRGECREDDGRIEEAQSSSSGIGALSLKRMVVSIVEEYFVSCDCEELEDSLDDLDADGVGAEAVKRCIVLSFDRSDRERELTSRLISYLAAQNIVSITQIRRVFEVLFTQCSDLSLDIPAVDKLLARFVARAVSDDILPPGFITEWLATPSYYHIVQQAVVLLSMRRSGAMLEHVWSIGPDAPLLELKTSVSLLIKEFLMSLDFNEAAHLLKEMNVPHFHHEVVKRSCLLAMDSGEGACESVSALLTFLYFQDILSQSQLGMGFERVAAALEDLQTDTPDAPTLFNSLITRAIQDGIVPKPTPASSLSVYGTLLP